MTDHAYQNSMAGFTSKLRSDGAPKPQPARGAGSAINANHSMFRKMLAPSGFVSGVRLAQDSLTAGRSIYDDFELLINEAIRTKGLANNHANARLVGYVWQLDETITAMRAAGVEISFPPLDAEDLTKRLGG